MSISAVSGVSPATQQQTDEPKAVAPVPAVTPFSQQLDPGAAQAGAAHGHHHHHGGASQSVTTSAASAASAAGVAPSTSSVASSLLNLLS